MPLIYAFVARGPTVLAEHTSHSGNFATVAAEVRLRANLPTRWGMTRRDASRDDSPRGARRAPRGARARDATRFEGVGAILSRTTATPARVPCRAARPPRTRGAKRPTASVFFSASDQISSLPASPAPSPAPGLARLRARPPRRDCPLAFVSRRVSFPSFPSFPQTLPKMIEQLQAQKKFTLVADGHTFNYLESDGYVFLVVADEAFGRQVPFSCLDAIAAEFAASYGERARDAIAHSLNRSFAPALKRHMEAAGTDPGAHSKVSRVQQQVSEVKEIMMDNIEKVLDRGEKIELLVDKTENLRFQADNFHRTGRALRRRMWWQNLKMKLVFASIVLVVVLILFLSFCYSNGNDCTKKEE